MLSQFFSMILLFMAISTCTFFVRNISNAIASFFSSAVRLFTSIWLKVCLPYSFNSSVVASLTCFWYSFSPYLDNAVSWYILIPWPQYVQTTMIHLLMRCCCYCHKLQNPCTQHIRCLVCIVCLTFVTKCQGHLFPLPPLLFLSHQLLILFLFCFWFHPPHVSC